MRGFALEIMAKLAGLAELFLVEQAFRPDAEKCPGQLIMMGIAVGQPVIIDEYLELALAQRRAVEMGQVIDRRSGRVHGRLVDQMDLAQKGMDRSATARGREAKRRKNGIRDGRCSSSIAAIAPGQTLDRSERRVACPISWPSELAPDLSPQCPPSYRAGFGHGRRHLSLGTDPEP